MTERFLHTSSCTGRYHCSSHHTTLGLVGSSFPLNAPLLASSPLQPAEPRTPCHVAVRWGHVRGRSWYEHHHGIHQRRHNHHELLRGRWGKLCGARSPPTATSLSLRRGVGAWRHGGGGACCVCASHAVRACTWGWCTTPRHGRMARRLGVAACECGGMVESGNGDACVLIWSGLFTPYQGAASSSGHANS